MTPAGSIALQLALSVATVIFTAYVARRVHQWYRHGFNRDLAYRKGCNQASRTLFQLAVRNHPVGSAPAAASAAPTAAASPAPAQVRAVVPRHHLPARTATDVHAERRETARLLHHQV
ncbi:hypothetical protein [Couchioplanes caeruleus]|uniref:Uncharacterized protein n=2 Tax=Couchioplanes caeruleus TaxID=56438 RepID=A0A1K0GGE0_9ACTN|nr:hypothetical protein [Couchioplanes caeruleus]OJF11246.1 hypothetical protein BG844_27575 [Couchioplanes caeruleus subsp. caeruleus]ROP32057.1 hypothetical protein EDD30_4987 [Couchioplanes caeruleus]